MASLRRSRRGPRAAAVLAGAASAAAAGVEASLETPRDPTAAAFFDVDNTMIRGASIYFFGKGMAGRGLLTTSDLLRFGWQQLQFRVRGEEDLDAVASARVKALGLVTGMSVEEIVTHGEEIYDELMERQIWAGTRALAQQHLDAGQRVFLVTATPVELARIISRRLGLTGALGTVSEVEDGRYTGRLVGEPLHGPAKAEAVRALAAREGLDLARCTAYSDSLNDVPMLELVGHAVAVNPDTALREQARARGWAVRDFRTGRRAARVGVPAAAGLGALSSGVLAGLALHRRQGVLARRRQRPVARLLRGVAVLRHVRLPRLSELRQLVRVPAHGRSLPQAAGAAGSALAHSAAGVLPSGLGGRAAAA